MTYTNPKAADREFAWPSSVLRAAHRGLAKCDPYQAGLKYAERRFVVGLRRVIRSWPTEDPPR